MSQSRRDFLKSTVGLTAGLSLSSSMPGLFAQAASASSAASEKSDRILVIVQLSGGNDGLNTVVPFGDDVYGRGRKTLRLTGSEVHKIDSMVGFHPKMPGFAEMFKEGHLSVVQGVGYPQNDRDHDGALRDWHTARPGDSTCQTGWIGRLLDQVDRPDTADVVAALVANIARPFALNAEGTIVPSVSEIKRLSFARESALIESSGEGSSQVGGDGRSLLRLVQRGRDDASTMSQRVQDVVTNPSSAGEYPSFDLARQFQTVAQLAQADLGIRVFFTESGNSGGGIGGFDNHANQRDNHASLLRELSASVSAFVNDMKRRKMLDRVLLMTFSEFGRTVTENGRRGTGHGAAAPVFLAGGRLKGGLIGSRPSLTDLDQDAPKIHTDFRQLYATTLDDWLGFDSRSVLGSKYESVDVFA